MTVAYVSPRGDIDLAAVPGLRRQWLQLIDDHHPDRLVIDLSDVPFLDCPGVGLIVSAYNRQRALGASLAIVNPRPSPRRILSITGLDALVDDKEAVRPVSEGRPSAGTAPAPRLGGPGLAGGTSAE